LGVIIYFNSQAIFRLSQKRDSKIYPLESLFEELRETEGLYLAAIKSVKIN